MAKPLNLEDLLPSKPEFVLDGATYTLRPPNMLDQVWIKETFGNDFGKILPNSDWPKIAKFVYHHLDEKGQIAFRARKVRIINEETGEEVEKFFTASEILLTSIKNLEVMAGIMGAVYRAISISNPMVEEIVKKQMAEQVKTLRQPEEKLVGAKSSTPSKANTGGRRKKSRS